LPNLTLTNAVSTVTLASTEILAVSQFWSFRGKKRRGRSLLRLTHLTKFPNPTIVDVRPALDA
jgi:hypothetical protein